MEPPHAPQARDRRRGLPPVDRLLAHPEVAGLVPLYGRERVRVQARREVEALRPWLAADPPADEVEHLLETLVLETSRGPATEVAVLVEAVHDHGTAAVEVGHVVGTKRLQRHVDRAGEVRLGIDVGR